jgi:hypothetical protein
MQISIEISEEQLARATELGLTPEAYVHDLLSQATALDSANEVAWVKEAERRAGSLDAGSTKVVAWEEIEARLRSRIAG